MGGIGIVGTWAAAAAPTVLSNALLEPPAAAVIDTLIRATQDQPVADRFVSRFGDPEGMLALLLPNRQPAEGRTRPWPGRSRPGGGWSRHLPPLSPPCRWSLRVRHGTQPTQS